MSLAIYAAPFNEDNNKSKITSKVNSKRVTNLLNKIHGSVEDEGNNLVDFAPPPHPTSSGVQKTVEKEGFASKQVPEYTEVYNNDSGIYQMYQIPQTDNNNYHTGNEQISKLAPNDNIDEKLNTILKLLNDQQDYKTENVVEEIILYSFFGIFIIYLVDSFKRVGKYTR
uniref:Uncharacterized protein n=1 Tax=viral metagenome TaxID=1070528 RepID=A0A6C0LIQ1_9ZZZZ|tara:strand:+ start:1419 stop:1925 length:507 start_codon:yes stop_codon:yes gene_type:complete